MSELDEFLRTHTPDEIAKHQHYDKNMNMCFIVLPSGKRWRFYSCIFCDKKHHIRTQIEEWVISLLIEDSQLDEVAREVVRNNGRICGPCFSKHMDSVSLNEQKEKADKEKIAKEKQIEKEKRYTVIYGYD